ncbi:MAG: hypothetical protein R3E86_03475 [Pseudomonadales bacterium]
MARPVDRHAADGESLQTDVMRFMAIIAFCLIAILALVRNVAAPAPLTDASSAPIPVTAQAAAAAATGHPASQPPAEPEISRQPTAQAAPAPDRSLEPLPQLPAPSPATPTTARRSASSAPAATSAPAAKSAPQPAEPAAEGSQQGLSLRFASDSDFLRLVSKGDIQVFAFRPSDVLMLDRDLRFGSAPPPGRVYELESDTIPALINQALRSASTEAGSYTWGISLPARLERRIRQYVQQGATGELIINRFGEVLHVARA